jgi:hypothetical protein
MARRPDRGLRALDRNRNGTLAPRAGSGASRPRRPVSAAAGSLLLPSSPPAECCCHGPYQLAGRKVGRQPWRLRSLVAQPWVIRGACPWATIPLNQRPRPQPRDQLSGAEDKCASSPKRAGRGEPCLRAQAALGARAGICRRTGSSRTQLPVSGLPRRMGIRMMIAHRMTVHRRSAHRAPTTRTTKSFATQ